MIFEGGAFGRLLGHEGKAIMNSINAFIKEVQRASSLPSAMWGYREKLEVYKLGSKPSPEAKSAGT